MFGWWMRSVWLVNEGCLAVAWGMFGWGMRGVWLRYEMFGWCMRGVWLRHEGCLVEVWDVWLVLEGCLVEAWGVFGWVWEVFGWGMRGVWLRYEVFGWGIRGVWLRHDGCLVEVWEVFGWGTRGFWLRYERCFVEVWGVSLRYKRCLVDAWVEFGWGMRCLVEVREVFGRGMTGMMVMREMEDGEQWEIRRWNMSLLSLYIQCTWRVAGCPPSMIVAGRRRHLSHWYGRTAGLDRLPTDCIQCGPGKNIFVIENVNSFPLQCYPKALFTHWNMVTKECQIARKLSTALAFCPKQQFTCYLVLWQNRTRKLFSKFISC